MITENDSMLSFTSRAQRFLDCDGFVMRRSRHSGSPHNGCLLPR